ncbi:MAG: hypothetical protein FWC73_02550 [Defluviitaleaceae bacterium]|nr:hypothetical protein [Defluviitaleaceae bacterium]
MNKSNKEDRQKIVLSDELQKEMMSFFMKTSIPRIAKEKRKNKNKTLSEPAKEDRK